MRQIKISQSITDRSDESLDKYLAEINHIPQITAEQEVELAQTIRKGGKMGKNAKDKLVTANLRFVVSVAKQYQNKGISLADLINEGNVGLITAAEKFDETRGFKFISYAIWWIRQSILQAISEYSNIVRRPLNQVALSSKIKNATNEYLQKHQRHPSAEELSDIISMEIDKIEKAILAEPHVTSIDAPIKDGEDTVMADMLSSSSDFATDRKVNHDSMCADLIQLMCSVLSDKEKTIVTQSFGIGCQERALDDIGQDMGLTRERVRQIRERGLDKMRQSNNSIILRKHLG
jgi:RNA polymerase primary sigma factor